MTGNIAVALIMEGGVYINFCAERFDPSKQVDMYNATSNSWTTYPEGLGQARSLLAAASSASGLVLFAGGTTSGEGP